MAISGKEIRNAISKLSASKNSRRYPPALRLQITRYARKRLVAGVSVGAVCRELDVGEPTLCRFLGRERPSEKGKAGFRRMRVVAAPSADAGGVLVVRGPCGLVIEDMSIEELADLLRSLSCSA